jgi:DNA-binding NtrC family response regulator
VKKAELPSENLAVLIVDDDPVIRDSLSGYLQLEDWEVDCAESGSEALQKLAKKDFGFVITDINMQGLNGIELLHRVKRDRPETEVIIMTGKGTEEFAIQALRAGATDYFHKPIQGEAVSASLMRSRRVLALKSKNSALSALVSRYSQESESNLLIGKSSATLALKGQLEKVAQLPETTVLLTGESGVGKEVAARIIHQLSHGEGGSFIALNCGGVSESLLERELFGHEKGAFTGADKRTPGVFEMAMGGTVLLDEIGEMTPSGQTRLLRVLEERSFRRVGGTREVHLTGTRIIAATNKRLETLVQEKLFREDLYFRLNVVPVHVPPLREREEDIPLLAEHYLGNAPTGGPKKMTREALALLQSYPFPGNVRELKNIVEHAAIFCSGEVVEASDLSFSRLGETAHETAAPLSPEPSSATSFDLEETERSVIRQAMQYAGGNHSAAARALGITPQALYRRLAKYKLA